MSQGDKSAVYQALKAAGKTPEGHYRDYTVAQLQEIAANFGVEVVLPAKEAVPAKPDQIDEIKEQIAGLGSALTSLTQLLLLQNQRPAPEPVRQGYAQPQVQSGPTPPPQPRQPTGPDPLLHAGVTLNTHAADEPVRVDEHGNRWFQNEVQKPGYAKPRGRRVLRYMDSGVKEETITTKDGYVETFEVPGDEQFAKPMEAKVTLPSHQTGIYLAPGMPFKIHVYQGAQGFDWDDVIAYYGSVDMVPDTIKRVYVSYDLCWDIPTTIRAVKDELRELELKIGARR